MLLHHLLYSSISDSSLQLNTFLIICKLRNLATNKYASFNNHDFYSSNSSVLSTPTVSIMFRENIKGVRSGTFFFALTQSLICPTIFIIKKKKIILYTGSSCYKSAIELKFTCQQINLNAIGKCNVDCLRKLHDVIPLVSMNALMKTLTSLTCNIANSSFTLPIIHNVFILI